MMGARLPVGLDIYQGLPGTCFGMLYAVSAKPVDRLMPKFINFEVWLINGLVSPRRLGEEIDCPAVRALFTSTFVYRQIYARVCVPNTHIRGWTAQRYIFPGNISNCLIARDVLRPFHCSYSKVPWK